VFENRALRRIFGSKGDEVTGEWRKLLDEELNDLYCSPNIVRAIKLRGSRSQWPRGLRRRSAAARLLRLWVRIPPGGMDVCRECCVLSSIGLCVGLITRPEESYRLWCV